MQYENLFEKVYDMENMIEKKPNDLICNNKIFVFGINCSR